MADLEVLSAVPRNPVVLMIASGGETAIQLGRQNPAQLHLVDMNPAQLALTRLKWHLAGTYSSDLSRALLGYDRMAVQERHNQLSQLLEELELPSDVFGPLHQVAEWGPDFSGRYERTFAELRRELAAIEFEIQQYLNTEETDLSQQPVFDPLTISGQVFDAAFAKVMSLENLICLFGENATQNPRQPFATHFASRTRLCFARTDRGRNPFLWQILTGTLPPNTPYDWLSPALNQGHSLHVTPQLHCGRMIDVLRSFRDSSVDMVHLSNILDWLSPAQAVETLEQTQRVLTREGRVIVRQLNSTLNIPALPCGLQWNLTMGREMVNHDRSFFYPEIFVGARE